MPSALTLALDYFPTMSSATIACDGAQDAIGYPFKNKLLLLEALDTTGMRTAESNQRLAMLGDALTQIILLDSWYASGTSKGAFTA